MKPKKTLYYSDEINDEVVNFKINKKKIDKNYKYLHHNFFYKIVSWFTYRIIAMPIFFLYFLIFKPVRFKNRKVLKQSKEGYFVYGNHTNQLADGCAPTFICFPKKPYIICSAENVFIPFIGKFNQMWGALPIPDTLEASKNFHIAIEKILNKKNPIIIYPEAHLWPYYTKIRPFSNISFRYPIKYNKPAYSFTTIYRKRKFFKTPKAIIYIDGPFFYDNTIPEKDAQQKMRDKIYKTMVERSKLNNCEYIIYKKKER